MCTYKPTNHPKLEGDIIIQCIGKLYHAMYLRLHDRKLSKIPRAAMDNMA